MSVNADELGAAESEEIPETEASTSAKTSAPATHVLAPLQASGGRAMAIIPRNSEEVARIATVVIQAGFAPYGLRTVSQLSVAILHGAEVGLPPMMAIQSIAVINGRPSLYGDGALGLIRASGRLEYMRESLNEKDKANLIAVCVVKRKGEPALTRRFSQADAITAKLWGKLGKSGEPTPWVTYPRRMLAMRARSWALRDAFADVFKGLAIAEEQMDIAADYSGAATVKVRPPGLE